MRLRSLIKEWVFKKHIWIEKINSKVELEKFISRFREKYVACELLRIGGDGDGGYLVPNNLKDISHCYSPGVSFVASFEKELADRYDIKSYMVDASVDKAPISGYNFEFLPKYLGTFTNDKFITLADWLSDTSGCDETGKILQMDIEGSEYDVLILEDAKTLASFSTIIIEFHSLEKLFDKNFLRMVSSIFEKIYKHFSICHVHPNNCCGIAELDGFIVPRTMEVTFIRNDYIEKCSTNKEIILPHILDRKNIDHIEDLVMPEIWWKKYY